ncbi:outer membrane protein [Holospora curviuscula]|uniref:outer membrane protein n=1 Tax=Holospora curviuscula TaxID=1082868 RepID=UPI000CE5CC9E|nr:hypothetical protein [Holospora curviuscula]
MHKNFKLVYFLFLATTSLQAGEEIEGSSSFQSGIGITMGLGVANSSTSAKDGTASNNLKLSGYYYRQNPQAPFRRIGNPNELIDFSNALKVKNKSGVAWTMGALFQKRMGFYTMGLRWLFGSLANSSRIAYSSGFWHYKNNPDINNAYNGSESSISENNITAFQLKNKWFTSFIFEFGYIIGNRIQLFAGPGVSFQRQKLASINSSGKSSGGISKTVSAPMVALGARYALTQRMSLGLEYQRQWMSKKTWHQISKIVPEKTTAVGAPTFKTTNNVFLMTLTYMFGAK